MFKGRKFAVLRQQNAHRCVQAKLPSDAAGIGFALKPTKELFEKSSLWNPSKTFVKRFVFLFNKVLGNPKTFLQKGFWQVLRTAS